MSDTTVTPASTAEAAAPWMPSALDKEADTFISSIEKEFEAAPPPDEAETTPQPEGEPPPPAPDAGTTAISEAGKLEASKPEQLSDFVKRELEVFRREEAVRAA